MRRRDSVVGNACPIPPDAPALAFEIPDTKPRIRFFTFKRVYIAVAIALIVLIPTTLVLSGDAGVRHVMVGQVLEVQYYSGLYPYTSVSYAVQPLKDASPFFPKELNRLYLNGDVWGFFKVGSYYNLTIEKRVLTLYPDLREMEEVTPITRMVVVTSVSWGMGGRERRYVTSIGLGSQELWFNGDYRGLFESRGYYNITWFGDELIGYQKLANPYVFWVYSCELTNYDSKMLLMRMTPGNDTILGVLVDDVPCLDYTPVTPRDGDMVGFTFKVAKQVEKDRLYTVSLRMGDGDIRQFSVKGKSYDAVNLFA